MNQKTEGNIRLFGPTILGVIFAVLQAFTVYYTKSVETRISQLDQKLDQTWETALVTKTELAAVKTLLQEKENDITRLDTRLTEISNEYLRHVSESRH